MIASGPRASEEKRRSRTGPSILFLAHRIPFPPDRGDKIRSWHLLRQLARFGRVHLACFADDEADAAHLPALRHALGERLGEVHVEIRGRGKAAAGVRALLRGQPISLALFDSPRLRDFVGRLLSRGDVDTIFAFSGQMAQFVPDRVRQHFVMDLGDVDSEKFAEYAFRSKPPMRWIYAREANRLFRFERATAARADVTTFVTEAEAELFRALTGLSNIRALSNGIDLEFFDPDARFDALPLDQRGKSPLLLFTGQMDYAPNVDAVTWFADRVLPRIPGARFVIAGRAPTAAVKKLAGERVAVTGAVADMRSWLAVADVVVAPLRIARGIQNKVLEAMAMARPVVASSSAFAGIDARPGRDLIVADEAEAMAESIARLLASSNLRREIGKSARDRIVASYSWEERLAPLARMLAPDGDRAAA